MKPELRFSTHAEVQQMCPESSNFDRLGDTVLLNKLSKLRDLGTALSNVYQIEKVGLTFIMKKCCVCVEVYHLCSLCVRSLSYGYI